MRRNYDEERASALEEENLNPMQTLVTMVVLAAVVVIFCFAVWKITHANRPAALPGANTENSMDSIADWGVQSSASETEAGTSEEPSAPSAASGQENPLGMEFETVDEYVTAKEVTNLRSEPSTDQGQLTVITQLSNGQSAHRIGMNATTGWSQLEYNGQVVYAVSQYLTVVDAPQ